MNKAELINRIAELDDIESKAAATRVIECLIGTVTGEVAEGNEVVISGLGKFYPHVQAAKSGTMNGKAWESQEKRVPKFKAASAFKQAVTA
jgi:DNA-binding protein HU-beta